VQQLVVSYVANGYFFYVLGQIPERKAPEIVDQKLVERYGIDVSKWARLRQRNAGRASVQYLRYGRTFILIATPGDHSFFLDEASVIRDLRRTPIRVFGYAVSHRRGHAQVRIAHDDFKRLERRILDACAYQHADSIAADLARIPYEPYAGVRHQLVRLIRAVNLYRRRAGQKPIAADILRMKRRIVRPFAAAGLTTVGIREPEHVGIAAESATFETFL
jgi:hypothetical protein